MKAWENKIRKVTPYTPGDQPQGVRMIKLNTNENPYPPAPAVAKALQSMDVDQFRKYPDPTISPLVQELAKYYQLNQEQVFVGVGSDDVLAMAFLTFFNSDKPILFPEISYSFYPVWADLFQIPYQTPALDDNFQIVKEDYEQENGGVIFPNPNAPTGVLMPLDEVEEIIRHNQDVIVIIDEAYIDFGGISALSLIDRYENLLIVQTFSKARSMAGMRIGYAMGHADLITALNRIKYSFNSYTLNMPAMTLGIEAVKDKQYFNEITQQIIETREETKKRLQKLGFSFPDSQANFLFVTHPLVAAKDLYQALCEHQIYVRFFDVPGLDKYLRISIGTNEEMDLLDQFLIKYLSK